MKAGIFVDAINISQHGGFGIRYDILRKYAEESGVELCRMNVYLVSDVSPSQVDSQKIKIERFCSVLRDFGFKVIELDQEWGENIESDEQIRLPISELKMAVDILSQSKYLDVIYLLTNDISFIPVIEQIQSYGCKVELIAFDAVDERLKKCADLFSSGYLIPGLLPVEGRIEWGTLGSRVRGVCYDFNQDEGYGFLRYMTKINGKNWILDSRSEESPYQTIFAHISQFESNFDISFLPSREIIFEFDLIENEKGLIAHNIILISAP